jgi:hypothetical protein
VVGSLKVLDPRRPIREADIERRRYLSAFGGEAGMSQPVAVSVSTDSYRDTFPFRALFTAAILFIAS